MKNVKKGFTIIELSLSVAFVAVLLIGVATIVMSMTSIYQKGLTMKAINATGQQIIEDLQRTVGASTRISSAPYDTDASGKITPEGYSNVTKTVFFDTTKDDKQRVGVLCLGNYAYAWNTADILQENNKGLYIGGKRYRFARFSDPGHDQCNTGKSGTIANLFSADLTADNRVDIAESDAKNLVELIQQDETDIALYDFRIAPIVQSGKTNQAFFSGSFILATIRGGVNINSNGDYCKGTGAAEDEYTGYEFDYCAVNKFNFSMRTGGNASLR